MNRVIKVKSKTYQKAYEVWIKQVAQKFQLSRWPLVCACIGEFFGTTIQILFGLGASSQRILGHYTDRSDFLSLSLNWSIGVTMSLFISGVIGAGLMNPAFTLAFAVIGKVPLVRVLPFTVCQYLGASLGTFVLLAVYNQQISTYALVEGWRQMNGTGHVFATRPIASNRYCVLDQVGGTIILAGLALAIGDRHNFDIPPSLKPLYLGLLSAGLKNSFLVNCGGAFNPARDLGPRIALLICGWGTETFRDADYYFWIPIVGAYVGALVGAVGYKLLVGVHLAAMEAELETQVSKKRDNRDYLGSNEDDHIVLVFPRHSRIVILSEFNRQLSVNISSVNNVHISVNMSHSSTSIGTMTNF